MAKIRMRVNAICYCLIWEAITSVKAKNWLFFLNEQSHLLSELADLANYHIRYYPNWLIRYQCPDIIVVCNIFL